MTHPPPVRSGVIPDGVPAGRGIKGPFPPKPYSGSNTGDLKNLSLSASSVQSQYLTAGKDG